MRDLLFLIADNEAVSLLKTRKIDEALCIRKCRIFHAIIETWKNLWNAKEVRDLHSLNGRNIFIIKLYFNFLYNPLDLEETLEIVDLR